MTRFSHVLSVGAVAAPTSLRVSGAMRAIAADHTIFSVALTNLSDTALDLDLDISAWRQDNGLDSLTPSDDLRVKVRHLEVTPLASRIVCLAVNASDQWRERAYQLLFKNALDGALCSAIPLFVTPIGAKAGLCASVVSDERGARLVVANVGCAHARIERLTGDGVVQLTASPHLLAGAKAEIPLPVGAKHVRVVGRHMSGEPLECSAFEAPKRARAS